MQFNSPTQITILRKIIDCQSFKNYQENVLDRVYFSKVANLQCTDCTLFSEIVPKTNVFLKEHFSKSLWCSIVLIECDPAVHIQLFHQNQS